MTALATSVLPDLDATMSSVNGFDGETAPARSWTFLSNHGHVLLSIAHDPEVRLRDIATRVGITERAVQLIVADLVAGHYIVREKVGRRNRYAIVSGRTFRHPAEQDAPLDALLEIFGAARPVA